MMKVFTIECPDPIDLMQGRAEHQVIEKLSRILGYESYSFLVKSKAEFLSTVKYIASLDQCNDTNATEDFPLCIHISSHGNEDGLEFGGDTITWKDIFEVLTPLMSDALNFNGDVILIVSACSANKQKITREFLLQRKELSLSKPLKYIFVFDEDEIRWSAAVVAWTILYQQLTVTNLSDKKSVQNILQKIGQLDLGHLKYYRWDEKRKKYGTYSSNRMMIKNNV